MKSLGLIALFFALIASWNFSLSGASKGQPDLETHVSLQKSVANSIRAQVQKLHPEVTEIRFHRLWTKKFDEHSSPKKTKKNTIGKNSPQKSHEKIMVVFDYEILIDDQRLSRSSGEVIAVSKRPNEWQIQKPQIKNQQLDFLDGLTISTQ